jgi:hypothetical protein
MHMDLDWRSHTLSLIHLEQVEINGLEGQDHEFDFLQLIFRCAPTLTRVTLTLSTAATPSEEWYTKICNMFEEYPFVENNLVLN